MILTKMAMRNVGFGEENKIHISKNIFNFSFTCQGKTKVNNPKELSSEN